MDNGLVQREFQRAGDLSRDRDPIGDRERAVLLDVPGKVDALDVFQHQEVTFAVFAEIIDLRDVGMIESGGRLGFALKTLEKRVVGNELLGDYLDGDASVERKLHAFVDLAHAALGDFADKSVFPQLRAGKIRSLAYGVGARQFLRPFRAGSD